MITWAALSAGRNLSERVRLAESSILNGTLSEPAEVARALRDIWTEPTTHDRDEDVARAMFAPLLGTFVVNDRRDESMRPRRPVRLYRFATEAQALGLSWSAYSSWAQLHEHNHPGGSLWTLEVPPERLIAAYSVSGLEWFEVVADVRGLMPTRRGPAGHLLETAPADRAALLRAVDPSA